MNGIKEDIKSVGVLKPGTSTYQEALYSLSARLKALQVNLLCHSLISLPFVTRCGLHCGRDSSSVQSVPIICLTITGKLQPTF